MRVRHLGGDVELELVVVGDVRVSELEEQLRSLLERLSQQDGLQRGVQLLLDVLEQARLAEPDAVFEGLQEVPLSQLDDLQVVLLLQDLEPSVGLGLGVDDQGPSSAVLDDDSIDRGEQVGRQAVVLPLPDLHLFSQDPLEGEVLRGRDLEFEAPRDPSLQHVVPVVDGEGPDVGDEGRRQ